MAVPVSADTRPRKVLGFKTPLEVFFANLASKGFSEWVLQLEVETAPLLARNLFALSVLLKDLLDISLPQSVALQNSNISAWKYSAD